MTKEETQHFDNLFLGVKQDIGGLKQDISSVATEVHTIKRGLYGDTPNGVKGMVAINQEQQKDIDSLKEARKKFMWTIGGAFVVVELVIQGFKLLS